MKVRLPGLGAVENFEGEGIAAVEGERARLVQKTAPNRTNSERYHSHVIGFLATTRYEATKNSQEVKAPTVTPISQPMIRTVRR
jgi:hypothetical protein